jgi:hypothetical protein
MALIQKDSKNRVSLGVGIDADLFSREVDERGRIIFTPQVTMAKDVYDSTIKLDNAARDRFVNALLSTPVRNEAFQKAEAKFNKKYKK